MPLRRYRGASPRSDYRANPATALQGAGGPSGIPPHDLPNASAALFRLNTWTLGRQVRRTRKPPPCVPAAWTSASSYARGAGIVSLAATPPNRHPAYAPQSRTNLLH